MGQSLGGWKAIHAAWSRGPAPQGQHRERPHDTWEGRFPPCFCLIHALKLWYHINNPWSPSTRLWSYPVQRLWMKSPICHCCRAHRVMQWWEWIRICHVDLNWLHQWGKVHSVQHQCIWYIHSMRRRFTTMNIQYRCLVLWLSCHIAHVRHRVEVLLQLQRTMIKINSVLVLKRVRWVQGWSIDSGSEILRWERWVEQSDGHRQKRLPVPLSAAAWWDESAAECTPVFEKWAVT